MVQRTSFTHERLFEEVLNKKQVPLCDLASRTIQSEGVCFSADCVTFSLRRHL